MSEHSTIASIAKSKAAANRAVKGLTVAQIEKAIANLSAAVKNLEKREAEKEAKRKAADLKKLTAMMQKLGLSAEEVTAAAKTKGTRGRPKTKTARKPRSTAGKKVAPKYEIKANGETIRWTGRGRMPVAFREFTEKGGKLDSCLIAK